jgi:hypothetical protein
VVLLNILYGFVAAVFLTFMIWFMGGPLHWSISALIWASWSSAHIIYELLAHWLVEYFNRDNVVTRDNYR